MEPTISSRTRVLRIATLALLATALAHVAAAQSSTRPDPTGTPTKIEYGVFAIDVRAIDSARQAFDADVALILRWRDPRLADAHAGVRRIGLGEIWHPHVDVANQLHVSQSFPDEAEVDAEGLVTLRQRYQGDFSMRVDLAEFPRDHHTFRIQFAARGFEAGELQFDAATMQEYTGIASPLLVSDWDVTRWETRAEVYAPVPRGRQLSGFVFEFEARRHIGYFVWKVLLPLALIVFMSWVVFWIDPVHIAPQMSVVVTSILTLIAYRFSLDALVPPVPYLTRFDHFLLGSTVLIFLALVEVTTTSAFATSGKVEAARRLDRRSRVAFPIAFAALVAWSFFA